MTANAPVIEASEVGALVTTVGAAASTENERTSEVLMVFAPASIALTRQ